MTWVIVPAIAALLALLVILVRSGLLRLRASVRKSWASLDELLLERHDLLTKLVEICSPHMRYEQQILERVSRADAATFAAAAREDIPALAAAEKLLRSSVAELLALAENYPVLGGDPGFTGLRGKVLSIAAAIAERREHYNSAVNMLNVRSQAFPHRLIARAIGLRSEALFE
ncbi:MAG: LemA family protein [Steroidobacteraceae bacterium]